jgi:hypothetical protein
MGQNGKGDKPRRKSVNEDAWAKNWERIFGKKTPEPKK